jgi:ATP-dependent DNA ligase
LHGFWSSRRTDEFVEQGIATIQRGRGRRSRFLRQSHRGIWVKAKCLNRQEFVVVGWSEPEGSLVHLGSLLLGYYDDDGRLLYAGRAGTGISVETLGKLAGRLKPLAVEKMPLAVAPPRKSRFGGTLSLSAAKRSPDEIASLRSVPNG